MNVVAYKNCGTPGLLPGESYRHDLDFVPLSSYKPERLKVLDGDDWKTLASFDLVTGSALGSISDANLEIYMQERYRGRDFLSAEEWSEKVDEWSARRPRFPGAREGVRGAAVGLRLTKQLDQDQAIRNDKWKHCVLGAEIARKTDRRTAEYAGWLKEHQDLTDGKRSSGFDELDFEATLDGAKQVGFSVLRIVRFWSNPSSEEVCATRWGDQYFAWDGTMPPL